MDNIKNLHKDGVGICFRRNAPCAFSSVRCCAVLCAIYLSWRAYFLPLRDWENKRLTSKPAPGSDLQTRGAPRRPAEPWCWSHPCGEGGKEFQSGRAKRRKKKKKKDALSITKGALKHKNWNSCTAWVRNGKGNISTVIVFLLLAPLWVPDISFCWYWQEMWSAGQRQSGSNLKSHGFKNTHFCSI